MDLLTTISFIVSETSDLSEMIPLVVWFVFARKNKQFDILGVFLIISATLKALSVIAAKMNIQNMPIPFVGGNRGRYRLLFLQSYDV